MPAKDPVDAAFGAMLGAFVGDAAGAVLEFNERNINPETVERAMSMPGGGVWGVGPGQITDDSELAMSLASGLAHAPPGDGFPDERVAQSYAAWYASRPFDIGNTCRVAFSVGEGSPSSEDPFARRMRKAATASRESQANGALMRITPLAVWGCMLSDEQLAEAAAADAKLSHPHKVCQGANAAYCIAIKHLIHTPGDAEGAIAAARSWADAHAHEDVRAWLADAVGDATGPVANRLIGFVKYGFFYAFRHLKLRSSYPDAVRQTLLLKGDTDTNAAIVGGMVGALHGASGVPSAMASPLLQRTVQSPGRKRPEWLQTSRLPSVFAQLWQQATGQEVDVTQL